MPEVTDCFQIVREAANLDPLLLELLDPFLQIPRRLLTTRIIRRMCEILRYFFPC